MACAACGGVSTVKHSWALWVRRRYGGGAIWRQPAAASQWRWHSCGCRSLTRHRTIAQTHCAKTSSSSATSGFANAGILAWHIGICAVDGRLITDKPVRHEVAWRWRQSWASGEWRGGGQRRPSLKNLCGGGVASANADMYHGVSAV